MNKKIDFIDLLEKKILEKEDYFMSEYLNLDLTKILSDPSDEFGIGKQPDGMNDFLCLAIKIELASGGISQITQSYSKAFQSCESPIEKLFLLALKYQSSNGKHHQVSSSFVDKINPINLDGGDHLFIEPQHKVGKYRVDFKVTLTHTFLDRTKMEATGGRDIAFKIINSDVFIECDGHDFHERTKDQAIKDRTKDRDLQSMGFPILRFTGSELWSNPLERADEVIKFLYDRVLEKNKTQSLL